MDRPSKAKSENTEKTYFQFGPLRGRPEFFYEHVPLCQEDPNCFRSTCGYCHPRRDSQTTHWSWVYPLENEQKTAEPKPLRSAVPPLLFGKQYENTEPSSLSRDSFFVEDSVILPNLDFLDTSDTPPPHNPWDFNSTDLKNGFDGPSLRKVGWEKVIKDMKTESKVKNRRIQSSLRTDAPPFQPTFYSPQPSKALEILSPTKPATATSVSVSSSITTVEDVKVATPTIASETKEPVEVDAFLRRMEVIKSAAITTPSTSPSKTSNQVIAPTSTPSTPSQETTTAPTTTTVTETTKVIEVIENPEKKPTPPPKVIPKSKSIPIVPPFKSKITTHTRTEQESLAPLLPLRGGSSTSTTVITEIISPKSNHVPKSLPIVSNLLERDDSSQSIDTGAKAPRAAWFVVLWSFVCSWIADLGQDIKDILAFVWAAIILRLPFFAPSASATPQSKVSVNTARPLRKPTAAKQLKARPTRSDQNDGKLRK
jgi:hypothetical protein